MGPVGDNTNRLIEYLLKVCPASFEAKTDQGYTPLFLSCLLGRVQFAKTLINAGADQSVKDSGLHNIIHASLTNRPDASQLRQLLNLFDPDLRSHLLLQRSNLANGGDTPIHFWLKTANPLSYRWDHSNYSSQRCLEDENTGNMEILKVILDYSSGAELEILNGSGDTVLHSAVINHLPAYAKALLAKNPELLCRENAVGRTPGEIAHDIFIGSKTDHLDPITVDTGGESSASKLERKSPESFLQSEPRPDRKERTWRVVEEYLPKVSGKRRLVSLNEANDVAKRLGDKYVEQRYFSKATTDEAQAEEQPPQETKEVDVVEAQYHARKHTAWKNDEGAGQAFRVQLGYMDDHIY